MEAWTSEHVLVPGYRAWARNGHRTYTGPTRAEPLGDLPGLLHLWNESLE